MTRCDVLVVGGGPGGSSVAEFVASQGIKTIVLEKKQKIGIPIECAEYVPWQIVNQIRMDDKIIAQEIDNMLTYIAGKKEPICSPFKGFMINRDVFDQQLAYMATKATAEFILNTKAISYDKGVVYAEDINKKNIIKIKPKVIVGADGASSVVSQWIGVKNSEFIKAAQYLMPLVNMLSSTCVYFAPQIKKGYGWVFPKKNLANVGVGIKEGNPKEVLDWFVEGLINRGILKKEVLSQTGGLIPVGGPLILRKENMVLVGDAGGLCHPITGAGITNAIISGKIAGEVIVKAIKSNDLSLLEEYQQEMEDILGQPLRRAYYKRRFLEENWDDGNLGEILHKAWIAFEEYYF